MMSRPNTSITIAAADAAPARSSVRVRRAVDAGAMVTGSDSPINDDSEAELPKAIHSRKKRKSGASHSSDEQSGESASDVDEEDDSKQHDHSSRPVKGKAAAAGSSRKRVVWTAEGEKQLRDAMLAHVTEKGRMPAIAKTGKGAACPADWKNIGKAVEQLSAMEESAAGKACSSKWQKVKKDNKVGSSPQYQRLSTQAFHRSSFVCMFSLSRSVFTMSWRTQSRRWRRSEQSRPLMRWQWRM
jgi:hypothetical protein